MSWEDDMDLMEEDYVFDGWREGQDYYDSAKDNEGGTFTARVAKDNTWNKTHLGEPVRVKII